MSLVILGNRLATGTLSKYYLHILDHREHTLSITEQRLRTSFGLSFEMLPFGS
jgi:hypothetical protein